MTTNACGFKIGTRTATLVVKLSSALQVGENATFAAYLADIDSGTPTFLLAAKTIKGPDPTTELRFKVQHNSEGPVIGFSQAGSARITLKFTDASAGLSIEVVCHLEIAMSASGRFESPDQAISLGTTVDWFVTN
jgi:hypothetical protein